MRARLTPAMTPGSMTHMNLPVPPNFGFDSNACAFPGRFSAGVFPFAPVAQSEGLQVRILPGALLPGLVSTDVKNWRRVLISQSTRWWPGITQA